MLLEGKWELSEVVLSGDRPVGYLIGIRGGLEDFGIPPNALHLLRIAVDPDYQGSGIGSLLVRNLATKAQKEGKDYVYVDVLADRADAIIFYEKCGFKTVKEVIDPKHPDARCLRMAAEVEELLKIDVTSKFTIERPWDSSQVVNHQAAEAFARQLQENKFMKMVEQRMRYLVYILEQYPKSIPDGFRASELMNFLIRGNLLLPSLFPNRAEKPLYKNICEVLNMAVDMGLLIRKPVPGESTYLYYRPHKSGAIRKTGAILKGAPPSPMHANESVRLRRAGTLQIQNGIEKRLQHAI